MKKQLIPITAIITLLVSLLAVTGCDSNLNRPVKMTPPMQHTDRIIPARDHFTINLDQFTSLSYGWRGVRPQG